MSIDKDLMRSLEAILPYAESRLEDMHETVHGCRVEHRSDARREYARALWAFRRARHALRAALDASLVAENVEGL